MWQLRNRVDLNQDPSPLMRSGNETKNLFSKPVLVHLKDRNYQSNNGATSSLHRNVTLLVTVETRHVISARIEKQELVVRLTDESDPFFLYVLTLNDDDFHSLKSSQKILVDFAAFPKMLVDRLELCLQEEYKDVPKFLLQLWVDESPGAQAVLEVVQTDHYQHVVLLSLRFAPASDCFVKKYLICCLKTLKEDKENLTIQLQSVEKDLKERLRLTQEQLQSKALEVDSARKEHITQTEQLKQLCAQEVRAELDRKERDLQDTKFRYEKERREAEFAHNKTLQQLESKISWLENQNKELQNKLYATESSLHELQGRHTSAETEIQLLRQQLQTTTKENGTLEANYHEQEKMLNHLQATVRSLEQQVRDKDILVARLEEQVTSLQSQKRRLEETCEQKENTLVRRETTVKMLSDEVTKGNEIIRKLQAEVQSCRTKLKKSGTISIQQEETVVKLEKEVAELRQDLAEAKQALQDKESEISSLNTTIKEQKTKMEEYENKIKTNNEVMAYLHKQLNEVQNGHRFSPSSLGVTSNTRSAYLSQATPPSSGGISLANRYLYNAVGNLNQPNSAAYANKSSNSPASDGERIAGSSHSPSNNYPLDPKYFERNPSTAVPTSTFPHSISAVDSAANRQGNGAAGDHPLSSAAMVNQQAGFILPPPPQPQPQPRTIGTTKQSPVPIVPVANRPRSSVPSSYFPMNPVQT